MEIIYAQEPWPSVVTKTLYLAGPAPRDSAALNWRNEALACLARRDYDGVVVVPLDRQGRMPANFETQMAWEQTALKRSDLILFWTPPELHQTPDVTTALEFGPLVRGRNMIFGYPQEALQIRALAYLAQKYALPIVHDVSDAIDLVLKRLGAGAFREHGETHVPLHLWKLPHFQTWLQAQKRAGNRLEEVYSIELQFGVGPQRAFLFYWGMHVNLWVAAEQRYKSNELVLSRPDLLHLVAYSLPDDSPPWEAEIVLIKEFRSPATTADGFIYEVPGGSSFQADAPELIAIKEFQEETGVSIAAHRVRFLAARQLAGTTTAHQAHVFAVRLTAPELAEIKRTCAGKRFGNPAETERTYPQVFTVRELCSSPVTDWSNLGMIFLAIHADLTAPHRPE